MHEVANILMRSYPNWIEHPTTDANFVYQCKDSVMTIFSDGSWHCEIPQRLSKAIRKGNVSTLEGFLKDFDAANPR